MTRILCTKYMTLCVPSRHPWAHPLGPGVGEMPEPPPYPTSLTSLHSRWNLFYSFAGGRALLPQRVQPQITPYPRAWAISL